MKPSLVQGRVQRHACGLNLRGARIVWRHADQTSVILSHAFASACDPEVSFDGKRLLFSAQIRPLDPWNIFEMNLQDRAVRQVTRDNPGHCTEPLYLPRASVTAPDFAQRVPWITFVCDDTGSAWMSPGHALTNLMAMSLAPVDHRGVITWRTTYGLEGDLSPTVLRDGRVLFSSWNRGKQDLMTVTWAGDNINPFFIDDAQPLRRNMACQTPDRKLIFVQSDAGSTVPGGQLVGVSMQRPLHSLEVLGRDDGIYATPHALPDGRLLVSHAQPGGSHDIYLFDENRGTVGTRIVNDPEWHDLDPQAVCLREEPEARIPMLEFASVLDIPGFEGAGQLHCMNVYDSELEEVRDLDPGTVKWVRFIQGMPKDNPQNSDHLVSKHAYPQNAQHWPPDHVATHVMGDAPVESDGSFFVNIVGNTPFYLQILDHEKQPLATMRAWAWVRSNSQRGCIGCHENKELAPQNRATQALIKMQPKLIGRKGEKVDP